MFAAQVIFTALLLGQITTDTPNWVPGGNGVKQNLQTLVSPADPPLAKVTSPGQPQTPPELVAQLLSLPADTKLNGRGVTLLEALSVVQDARQQIEVIHAYWRLAFTFGDYHIRSRQVEQLSKLEAKPDDEAILHTAKASGEALLREAELSVVTAQYNLARLALLSTDSKPPLPADRPHVGPYRTNFDQLFNARPAPEQTKLIARTMPIRCKAIDAHATAILAAEKALEAAIKDYQHGKVELEIVLSRIAQLNQQRRAIIASVCNYNHDIVDYAMSVADRPMTSRAIVAMLIEPTKLLQPLKPIRDTDVQPTSLNEPLVVTPQRSIRPAPKNQPTLAPPRDSKRREPTLAPLNPATVKKQSTSTSPDKPSGLDRK